MRRAVVGLGSNLGSREAFLECAIRLLAAEAPVRARSALYVTDALSVGQPTFLNAAVAIDTGLAPAALLGRLHRIEALLGRVRGSDRWPPRRIDLDLLHVDGVELHTPAARVPHPELGRRAFALAPLLDVAPDLSARWGEALAALGGPPPITQPWGAPIDALDRAALALAARLADGAPTGTLAVDAPTLEGWIERAASVPHAVVGGALDPPVEGPVTGRVLVGP